MQIERPCGCRPGFFACQEAERLWADVNAAYRLYDWDTYGARLIAYRVHVYGTPWHPENPPPTLTQAALPGLTS